MCCFNMSKVFVFSFSVLPLQCLALVIVTVPFSRFMSLTFNHVNSIGRVPRSFDMDKISAIFGLACAINMFKCSVDGIFGSLSYRS